MLDDLGPDDRVSHRRRSTTRPRWWSSAVAGDDPELTLAIDAIEANGATNIYDGLRTGLRDWWRPTPTPALQNRVILLSDGKATAGITSRREDRGDERPPSTPRATASRPSAWASRLRPRAHARRCPRRARARSTSSRIPAVQEVFEEEVTTFLVPLAEDLSHRRRHRRRVDVLRAIYGTKLFELRRQRVREHPDPERCSSPTARTVERRRSAADVRGGGGAMVAGAGPQARARRPRSRAVVGRIAMSYRAPHSDGETMDAGGPDHDRTGHPRTSSTSRTATFDGHQRWRSRFVMLNIFVGLQMAATRASQGDLSGAYNVLDALDKNVDGWLAANADFDIEDDLKYVRMFKANLLAEGATEPPPTQPEQVPPEPWPQD
jgi:Ca-activated chloride channel family protein